MNRLMACGRLSADPQVKESQNGNRYARFCMASPRSRRTAAGETVYDLFDCWCFAPRIVGVVSETLRKGTQVIVAGEIEIERRTDASGRDAWRPRLVIQELLLPENPAAAPPFEGAAPSSPVSRMAVLDRADPYTE